MGEENTGASVRPNFKPAAEPENQLGHDMGDDYLLGGLKLRSHRALYTRIGCHYHLEPWSPEEIKQLLQVSQQAVGLSEEDLQPAAVDLIISAAAGLPRTALQVARAAWIAASKIKASLISAEHVQGVLSSIPAVSESMPHSPS